MPTQPSAPADGSLPSGTIDAFSKATSAGKNATGSSSSIVNSLAEWIRKPSRSFVSPFRTARAPRTDENSQRGSLPDCSSLSNEWRTSRAPSLRPSWKRTSSRRRKR